MTERSFLTDWKARLLAGQAGVVLVEVRHPLEIYVGAGDQGRPLAQIRSKVQPPLHEISDLVLVERRQQGDWWILSLDLQDARFTDVFLRLVTHLVSASRRETTAESAWRSVSVVLSEWKRLLSVRPHGLLSLEELRGLVGELWLVLYRFSMAMPVDEVIAGWLGPLNAPQDFWYESTGFYEAKSIGPSAPRIKISSAHQLDERGMTLLVLQVPQVVESDAGALNLITLVEEVKTALQSSNKATDDLDVRLSRMGVDLDHPYYGNTWFRVTVVETFQVSEDFPAIRHSALPDGIEQVRYGLDRKSLNQFLVATERVSGDAS
ncbi:PD-(D/E)XK motif protein [Kineococcus endophyticus]|uniref:PD-(D/E)XK motif protein n=1 Tax=Kineococcus endophyticus TaxID=1181883 RepID=A0ABV3PDV0_9ACTN